VLGRRTITAAWLCSLLAIFIFACPNPGGDRTSERVAAPQFTPSAGSYSTDQNVTISCSTIGATMRYTTDGSVPTYSSPEYSGAIAVIGNGASMTIKAFASKAGMTDSTVTSATFNINYGQVSTPQFTPIGGSYSTDQNVTISCSTSGATIHYTTDGSMPTVSSPTYSSAILVAGNGTSTTIKAYAVKTGMIDSTVAAATYTVNYIPGALDTSFLSVGTGANSYVATIALQSDGKIIIGGNFTSYSGTSRGRVARLSADGGLDSSFLATGTGADNFVTSMAVQSDGKVLVGGGFSSYNGTSRGSIARLNTDGSLDTSFLATGAGANADVDCLAIQSDGKILIGGYFTTYNGTNRGRIARINTDGSLDTTFLASGSGASDGVLSIAVQSDGQIIIGGRFTGYNGTSRGRVARLNADGSLDTTFLATDVGAGDTVSSIAVQADGKILVGGAFGIFNGTLRGCAARLNADGTLDGGFLAAGAGASATVFSVALQTNGLVLLGGAFGSYNGTSSAGIARLNADGSIDTGFQVGNGAGGGAVYSVVPQSGGRILIGGFFSNYDGVGRGCLARLWN